MSEPKTTFQNLLDDFGVYVSQITSVGLLRRGINYYFK